MSGEPVPYIGKRSEREVKLIREYIQLGLEALGKVPDGGLTAEHAVATGYLAGLRACLFWLLRETSESVDLDKHLAEFEKEGRGENT